jgi:predicted dehydrogenase
MKAVVLGTGWGQVHVQALRMAGVPAAALWSRSAASADAGARQLGVPVGTDSLDAVDALQPDWVSIATPAATHAALASRFRSAFVLCEKPLVGPHAPAGAWQAFDPARSAVNHALPFLDEAVRVREALRAWHLRPLQLDIVTEHDLGDGFGGLHGLSELACHPLSLAVVLFGAPQREGPDRRADGRLTLRWVAADLAAAVTVRRVPGLQGLRHVWTLQTAEGPVCLQGQFRRGGPWSFSLRASGRAAQVLPPSQSDPAAGDPWLQANHRSIAMALAVARGERSLEAARAQGLTGVADAWALASLWQ